MRRHNSSDGTFGEPKPLPGSANFGTKETTRLENEAKEMEVKLQMLQMRMAQQRQEDANIPKVGGSRWNSARSDKGSATMYAKDVQERIKRQELRRQDKVKQKQQGGNTVAGVSGVRNQNAVNGSSDFRSLNANAPRFGSSSSSGASDGGFRKKEIESWTVKDVTDWLSAIKLDAYVSKFAENEIDGGILLELSLEDLDYMQMKILGHRKVILKGIEDLRKNRRVTIDCQASNSGGNLMSKTSNLLNMQQQQTQFSRTTALENLDDDSAPKYAPRKMDPAVAKQLEEDVLEENKKIVHWSQLEPLQQSQEKKGIISDGLGIHQNSADSGVIDEAEERRLFQEAVAEWRGEKKADSSSPTKVKIFRNGKEVPRRDTSDATEVGAKEGMWSNPFGMITSEGGESDLLTASPPQSPKPSEVNNSNKNGGSLLEAANADLDEEAERRAFAAAVAEWRNAGKTKAEAPESEASPSSGGTMTSPQRTSVEIDAPEEGAGGKAIAEALAKEMEEEQTRIAQEMQKKMEELTAKLEEAKKRSMIMETSEHPNEITEYEDLDDFSDASGDEYVANSSTSYTYESQPVNVQQVTPEANKNNSAPNTHHSEDDASFGEAEGEGSTTLSPLVSPRPVMSIVEASHSDLGMDVVHACVVEEVSDDED